MTKGARVARALSVYLWVVVARCTIIVPVQHAALFEIYREPGGWEAGTVATQRRVGGETESSAIRSELYRQRNRWTRQFVLRGKE